jgi:hypothetical protein
MSMTCSDNITLTDNVLIEQCKYDLPCDLLDTLKMDATETPLHSA